MIGVEMVTSGFCPVPQDMNGNKVCTSLGRWKETLSFETPNPELQI